MRLFYYNLDFRLAKIYLHFAKGKLSFCRRQIIIHAKRDYHSAKPTALLPIIYIIRNNRSLFPAVLEVGTDENYSVLRQQLACTELVDLAAEEDVGGGKNYKFVLADGKAAFSANDLVDVIDALGYVFDVLTRDALCHFAAETNAVGVLRLCPMSYYLTPKSHFELLLSSLR